MAKREALWDCTSCGRVGNLGRYHKCQCGAPKPIGTKHYLPENAPAVTDPALLKQAEAGTDFLCGYCGAMVEAKHASCPGCGATTADALRERTRVYEAHQVPRSGGLETRSGSGGAPPITRPPVVAGLGSDDWMQPRPRRRPWWIIPAAAAGITLVALLIWMLFSTSPVRMDLTAKSWVRTIEVEKEKTVREEDWDIPAGGREVSHTRKHHHDDEETVGYKKVACHDQDEDGTEEYDCGKKKDLGNGFFDDVPCTRTKYKPCSHECKEPIKKPKPVYKNYYTYDIEKWLHERTERSGGAADEPRWPTVSLASREREGSRGETYTLAFRDQDGAQQTYTPDLAVWTSLPQGARCTGKKNKFGSVLAFPDCR